MKNITTLILISTLLKITLCRTPHHRQDFQFNNFINPVESYIGPSSYDTNTFTTSNINDYPAIGDFGPLLNMKTPQITSSYSTFGPSESSKEFGSTSYINYPPQTSVVHEQAIFHDESPSMPPSNSFFGDTSPIKSFYDGATENSALPPSFSALISSTFDNLASANLPPSTSEVISQHVEVTKPVVVPVYKKFPYPQPKHFPVAIPHPVLVPVPAPYPVNVMISEPVAVPIIKEIKVPVEKEVMYPVEKNVPVEVEKPLKFQVEKHFPVYVPKPYPVKIPIVKTIIHKTPKKWSRELAQEKIMAVNQSLMRQWRMN